MNFYIHQIKSKILILKNKFKIKQFINFPLTLKSNFLFTKFNNLKKIGQYKISVFKQLKLFKTTPIKSEITFYSLLCKFNIKQNIKKKNLNKIFNQYNNTFIKQNQDKILEYFDLFFSGFCNYNNIKLTKTNNDLNKFLNWIDINNIKDLNTLIISFQYKTFWM